jgi:MFS family permease
LGAARNIRLYPWFKFFQNLTFWQAIWFLFFQGRLSAAEAVIFYAIYDIATTLLEVPSGYFSDRFGRRVTLILSGGFMVLAGVLLTLGDGFLAFAMAQAALGAGMAFASGTDTALLYESLTDTGRSDEVEAQEVRAWRFSFAALALSALSGGLASLIWERLPFLLSALAYGAMLLVILRLSEPSHRDGSAVPQGDEALRLGSLKRALLHPVLIWLFLLGVLMYGFSHLPFIFGQPFILQALETRGLETAAPLVSGAVTTVMMLVSVVASWGAVPLRNRIGLPAILILAFGIQVLLAGVLAATASLVAVVFLFLRMVPDAMSRPFIMARIQPLLNDDARATYLSLRSLVARLAFAGSLLVAAGVASPDGAMPHEEISRILTWYAGAGLLALVVLAGAARHLPIEPGD